MQIIAGDYKDAVGRRIADWYVERSKWPFHTVYTATGFIDEFEFIRAAAIFTDYNGSNIELHFYGDRALNRQMITSITAYVFGQLGCIRLTIKILRKDKHIAKTLTRLGFEYECTLKSYYGLSSGLDALVFRAMKSDAEKWMK